MPGYLLTMNCMVTCPHGGQAKPVAPNPRVKIMGTPIPMSAPPFVISGCSMVVPPPAGPGPTPCITAMFLPPTGTTRVKSMGQPLLCNSSATGPCITTPPSPPAPLLPVASAGQTRVRGQ
jgi:hypothetical protein